MSEDFCLLMISPFDCCNCFVGGRRRLSLYKSVQGFRNWLMYTVFNLTETYTIISNTEHIFYEHIQYFFLIFEIIQIIEDFYFCGKSSDSNTAEVRVISFWTNIPFKQLAFLFLQWAMCVLCFDLKTWFNILRHILPLISRFDWVLQISTYVMVNNLICFL